MVSSNRKTNWAKEYEWMDEPTHSSAGSVVATENLGLADGTKRCCLLF